MPRRKNGSTDAMPKPDRAAGEASGQAEHRRLTEVEHEDLARPKPETLEDRDRVAASRDPDADRLADADAADQERQESDQPEIVLQPIESAPQRRLRLVVGLDAPAVGARRDRLELVGARVQLVERGRGRQLDQDPVLDAAAEVDQRRAIEARARRGTRAGRA